MLITAAARQNIRYIGMQRVPPARVAEQEAKDAILMTIVIGSLINSPFAHLSWDMSDFSPLLFRQAPESIKRDGRTVRVTFCNDPDTTTEYPYWLKYLFLGDGEWTEAEGGVDAVGIWYDSGGHRVYVTHWRDEAARMCPGQSPAWSIMSDRLNDLSLQTVLDAEAGPYEEPALESTRRDSPDRSRTVSPPELTRYSPIRPRGAADRRRRTATSTQRAERTAERQRSRTRGRQGTTRTRAAPRATAVRPEDVGTVRTTDYRRGQSRVERLIADARDPPCLVFEGYTGQLKTIRHRLRTGQFAHLHVSSTWHWVGRDGPDRSKIIVAFRSEQERDTFARTFYTGNSGVRVFHATLNGL